MGPLFYKMNILILTNHLNPGGITSYCLMLCRHLKKSPHRIMIASGGGECLPQIDQLGIQHFTLPVNTSSELNPQLLVAWKRLKHIVETNQIDVIHAQTRVTQVLSHLVSRQTGAKRIFTCHGFFKKRFFRTHFPLWPEQVIAISRPVQDHLIRDWGLKPEQVKLVFHGVEGTTGRDERMILRQQAREAFGLSDGKIVVGAFGRLSPVKGYHVLVKAFGRLKEKSLEAELWIVGDGPERKLLQDLIRKEGLEQNVRLVTEPQGSPLILHAFDIFCAPSIQEGFGLSIVEAMARRIVVAASRVGGILDLIDDDVTGLLVSPESPQALADALFRLMKDPKLRENLADAGCDFVAKNFTVEQMIQQTLDVYEAAQGASHSNPKDPCKDKKFALRT